MASKKVIHLILTYCVLVFMIHFPPLFLYIKERDFFSLFGLHVLYLEESLVSFLCYVHSLLPSSRPVFKKHNKCLLRMYWPVLGPIGVLIIKTHSLNLKNS